MLMILAFIVLAPIAFVVVELMIVLVTIAVVGVQRVFWE